VAFNDDWVTKIREKSKKTLDRRFVTLAAKNSSNSDWRGDGVGSLWTGRNISDPLSAVPLQKTVGIFLVGE